MYSEHLRLHLYVYFMCDTLQREQCCVFFRLPSILMRASRKKLFTITPLRVIYVLLNLLLLCMGVNLKDLSQYQYIKRIEVTHGSEIKNQVFKINRMADFSLKLIPLNAEEPKTINISPSYVLFS